MLSQKECVYMPIIFNDSRNINPFSSLQKNGNFIFRISV